MNNKLKKRIYIYLGTTAELIKVAPVIKELQRRKISFTLITTGQVPIYFRQFKDYLDPIRKRIRLKGKAQKSSIISFAFWAAGAFFTSLITLRHELNHDKDRTYLVVHGDTVSSLIGALTAIFYGVKLVHIESGLRSYNFFEPFPEELTRYIISRLSHVNFCPNKWAVKNLKNAPGTKVNTMNNTLIETFNWAINKKIKVPYEKIKGKYFALIVHRQEHVVFSKDKTRKLVESILKLVPKDITCVYRVHDISTDFFEDLKKRKVVSRIMEMTHLEYAAYMKFFKSAEFVVTDGGSNQEELSYMGKPTLILRNCTERIEGLNSNAVLIRKDINIVKKFIRNYKKYRKSSKRYKVYPSKIIVDYIVG